MIHVFDNLAPRMITLDPWPQQVFLDAEGEKTVKEYVLWMAGLYKGKIPDGLDEDMIKVIDLLIDDSELVKLKDEPTALPYYIKGPRSSLDKEKALALMKKDGYIKDSPDEKE